MISLVISLFFLKFGENLVLNVYIVLNKTKETQMGHLLRAVLAAAGLGMLALAPAQVDHITGHKQPDGGKAHE